MMDFPLPYLATGGFFQVTPIENFCTCAQKKEISCLSHVGNLGSKQLRARSSQKCHDRELQCKWQLQWRFNTASHHHLPIEKNYDKHIETMEPLLRNYETCTYLNWDRFSDRVHLGTCLHCLRRVFRVPVMWTLLKKNILTIAIVIMWLAMSQFTLVAGNFPNCKESKWIDGPTFYVIFNQTK